jgi:HAD superfamily hydrolase (TIGR01490 family)
MTTSRRLALFDLDHTLLPLDSDYQWAEFLAHTGRAGDPEEALRRNDDLMERYNRGDLTAEQAAEFMLGLLAAHHPHDLARFHEEYMQTIVRPAITERALELVRSHLDAGDLCAIVTATNTFVTAPIARAFGIQHLIGVVPEIAAGRYTGRFVGTPSFKEGKVVRVHEWLAGMGLALEDFEASFFYSDSVNDVPLLERVTRPYAVNPSPALRTIAMREGWPVLDLFDHAQDAKS